MHFWTVATGSEPTSLGFGVRLCTAVIGSKQTFFFLRSTEVRWIATPLALNKPVSVFIVMKGYCVLLSSLAALPFCHRGFTEVLRTFAPSWVRDVLGEILKGMTSEGWVL